VKQTVNAPVSSILPNFPHWISLPVSVSKDIRVAAAPAAWAIAILLLGALFLQQPLGFSGVAIHAVACSAIAAIVAGQDFLYRTASWNMALPTSRARIWRQRMLIAASAMLPVIACGFLVDWIPVFARQMFYVNWSSWRFIASSLFEPSVNALCLAPWLTLISRSPLFGTVFSIGTRFLLYVTTETLLRFAGLIEPEITADKFATYAMPFIWVAGAMLGWRKFMRLEVIEAWAGKAGTKAHSGAAQKLRRSSPTWQLFKKEMFVQRFPIALSVVAMGLVAFLTKEQTSLWTMVYPVALIVVIGSIASADERQMGTVEWQVLLPIAYWKQWIVKYFTTWGVAVVFGFILPLWIWSAKTGELRKAVGPDLMEIAPIFAAATFGVVTVTLYVSSLCNSGVRAVMASAVVNLFAAYLLIQSFEGYTNFLWKNGNVTEQGEFIFQNGDIANRPASIDWWLHAEYWPFLIAIFGAIGLAAIFSARNHRYSERGLGRILRQVAAFAVYEVLAFLTIFTFGT
jgi:hypothetical protein